MVAVSEKMLCAEMLSLQMYTGEERAARIYTPRAALEDMIWKG